MSLTRLAVRRPVTVVSATLAVVLLGAVSLGRMPVSLLPDVTLPVLTVRTAYPGTAAPEMSRTVAEPMEQAIGAIPGLVELRSVSRTGEVTTTARFAWGTDMRTTVLTVRERLDAARSSLPTRAERPALLTSDPGERPIAVLGVTESSNGRNGPRAGTGANSEAVLRALARTIEDVHARRLEQIVGVASVAVVGAPTDEIRIAIDPERLRTYGLSVQDVAQAVKDANVSATGGTIRRGQFRLSVRTVTELREPAEIADLPIRAAGGRGDGVVLRDIATISLASTEPTTLTRLDGARALGLVVYKDAGANAVAVTRAIYTTLDQLRREFPDVRVHVVAAQADFVVDALGNLGQEIALGSALSLLTILLFLRHWRTSLAIGLMVPLSVLLALVLLQAMDVTINILSLGGLALGVGLLVDNAIVVAEAAGRRREEGLPDDEAAVAAADEVAGPLTAGTLTTLLVFGPIIFVKGLAAALFRDLSLSVVTSVGASLLLALTLIPVMMVGVRSAGRQRAALPVASHTSAARRHEFLARIDRLGDRLANCYENGVRWSLAHPRIVFASALSVLAITVWATRRMPRETLPQVDEGVVVVSVRLLEGTALGETTRQVARVEAAARALRARGVYSRVGVATDEELLAGADPGTSASAQLIVPVPPGARATLFANALRRAVPDLAAGSLALDLAGQSEFGSVIGREGRLVRVEVSATSPLDSERWAERARAAMRRLPSLTDVRSAQVETQPMVEVTLARDHITERGISYAAVVSALAGGLGGVYAGDLRETDRRTPIAVRYGGAAHESLVETLAGTVAGVPLAQLVHVRQTRAPVEVVRVNQRPVTVIEGLIERGGTARAAEDVERVMRAIPFPLGVTWRVGGADAEQRRTTEQLTLVGVLAAALMFLVLAGEFASFTTPIIVMITVPLAGAGGLLLLWATGQSLNAVALIGLVVMIGMADNEAVVKIDAIRRLQAEGYPLHEAILLGGRRRLRAIAMTSITTITGVLPLVFGWGSGGALYQPLAASVIGGSVSALFVTFFVLPTAYAAVERRKGRHSSHAATLAVGDVTACVPEPLLGATATAPSIDH